MPAANLVV